MTKQIATADFVNMQIGLLRDVGRHIIATRIRDPSKPDYGLGDGGIDIIPVLLYAMPYTGTESIGIVIGGELYAAPNMSIAGEDIPDGNIIIRKEE